MNDNHLTATQLRKNSARVTAVIPTLAERRRRVSLLKAIQSLRNASSEKIVIIVVVNGNRFDPVIITELQIQADVQLIQIEEGSLPLALAFGRHHVNTPFFCFLDDDDEYLPGAIDLRLQLLDEHPEADIAITNGWKKIDGIDRIAHSRMKYVSDNAFLELFRANWLASCGALFRSKEIGIEYFENIHKFAEWTWIAFQLLLHDKKIVFINEPTFRINSTEGSLSKSTEYQNSFVKLFTRMLQEKTSGEVRRAILSKRSGALHDLSNLEMRNGNMRRAWKLHLESLQHFRGWRYFFYTRHLLAATVLRK